MNNSVVMQYVIENIFSDPTLQNFNISINVGSNSVSVHNSKILVKKEIETRTFDVSNPDCYVEITKYLNANEDRIIRLNYNDYLLKIKHYELVAILRGPKSYKEKSMEIQRVALAYSNDHNYHYDVDDWKEEYFNEFVEEFYEDEKNL